MTNQSASLEKRSTFGIPDLALKACFSLVFAILMAVSANAFIYLPFTPVPVTLQVLTVIFAAIMLGGPWAAVSQVTYITMGLAGLPVFAGFLSGPAVLMGPTGGYIIGFTLAAYVTGYFARGSHFGNMGKNGYVSAFLAGISGLAVIYILGGLHLCGFLYNLSPRMPISDIIRSAWIMGVKPFIILDAAKIIAAIIILRPGVTANEDN